MQNLLPHQNLLAVSKLQPIDKIKELYQEGQRDFGENYIQEALEKIKALTDLKISWHLIGPVQSNKVKLLQKNFAYLHAVDSLKLAQKISEEAEKIGYVQKVFLQINLSNEATKHGFEESELEKFWPELNKLKGLKIVGLMTMPPLESKPEKNRVFYKKLKYIGSKFDLDQYSMGTSHDYQIALAEGATWIRLGTTLFGERAQKRGQQS